MASIRRDRARSELVRCRLATCQQALPSTKRLFGVDDAGGGYRDDVVPTMRPSRSRNLSQQPSSHRFTLVAILTIAIVSCSIPAGSSTTLAGPSMTTGDAPDSSIATEPTVEPTQTIRVTDLSQEERTNLLATCLQERGWPVELDEKDPSAIDVPDLPIEQELIFLDDVRTCMEENGLQIAEPTRQDVVGGDHALVELKSCLAGLGYEVPDPPSLDAYLDAYPSGDAGGWHPYALLEWGQLTQQEQDLIQEECPQP